MAIKDDFLARRPWLQRNAYLDRIATLRDSIPPEFEKPLTPVVDARAAYYDNECKFFIAYGGHGCGKSTYASQCLAECNETWDPEVLKSFIVWKPEMFGDVVTYAEKEDKRFMMLVADDAGVWLNALKWNHPLLVALTEYFDVIRMHFASVMFTSPFPMHIVKRIRGLPQAITIKIIKVNNNPSKPRLANGYLETRLPDLKKTNIKHLFEDKFFAIMPNKFYNWYYPMRKGFTTEAYQKVRERIMQYKLEQQIHMPKESLIVRNP